MNTTGQHGKFKLYYNMFTLLGFFEVFFLCTPGGVFGICDVSQCTDPNTCVLSQSGLSCRCAVSYFGDGCEKAATMKVVCGKDFMTISVSEDLFKYYNVGVDSVHLSNTSCGAKEEVISGITYYTVTTPKGQYEACGGSPIERNISHVAYSLTLMSEPQVYGNIVRYPVIRIEYKCVYPYTRSISVPFPIIPFSSTSEVTMRMGEVDAMVEMSLYKDQTYEEAFTDTPTVQLLDSVFVQVSVTELKASFNLKVDACWATQSPKPNDTTSLMHVLLQNGCAHDETVSFLSNTINYPNGTTGQEGLNGEGAAVRFSFDMFRFVTEPHELYLHCEVQLCSRDNGETCVPECTTVTKREAPLIGLQKGLLSYGPIRVEVPQRSKSNMLVTLVLPMGVTWILFLFLFILISLAKAGNKRLAFHMNH